MGTFEQDYHSHFATFLAHSLGLAQPPRFESLNVNLGAFDEVVETELLDATKRLLAEADSWPQSPEPVVGLRRLNPAIEAALEELDTKGFRPFVADHFNIKSIDLDKIASADDFIFVKINHGFWEQICALYSDQVDPKRMRITDLARYRPMYVDSRFVAPLACLIKRTSRCAEGILSFQNSTFGFSLGNGTFDHQEIMRSFHKQRPRAQRVSSGAAVGAVGFFNALFPGTRLHVHDGCFPKMGLETGLLRDAIDVCDQTADCVIFVVPPHLHDIRLSQSSLPQEVLCVSGTIVHQSWIATLYAVSLPILRRLAGGDNLLVFTQSGVFSALLGLFLADAKTTLGPRAGRLSFFDLGQVLDVANPVVSGPWLRRVGAVGDKLFECDMPDVG